MTQKTSTWTTAKGATVEMITEEVTQRLWFTSDYGTKHYKKVDEIDVIKVKVNETEYHGLHRRETIDSALVINLGQQKVNGKFVRVAVSLPDSINKNVWGEYDSRNAEKVKRQQEQEKQKEKELREKIAGGYCPKCESYCWGDCNSNK